MESFIAIVKGLIEPLLGVIIGGLISLLTVWYTLRSSQKLHEDNIKEERRKIREAREFASKQDALQSACDAVTKFIIYYTSLADRTLPSDGIVAEEVADLNVAMNRLHFYCNLETIEKIIALNQTLSFAMTNALKVKVASTFLSEELKNIENQILYFENINANIRSEINAIIQAEPNSSLLVIHRQSLAQNSQKIADLCGKKPLLIMQKYEETEKCRDIIRQHLKDIYKVLSDVLLVARRELSFTIEFDKYKEIMENATSLESENLEGFLADIRKQVQIKMTA
jgi:hypothetical protein